MAVSYAISTADITISWGYTTAGTGGHSFALTWTDGLSGVQSTVSPATSPETLSNLNVPRVDSFSILAHITCGSESASSSWTGYFWTGTGSGGACAEGTVQISNVAGTANSPTSTGYTETLSWQESPSIPGMDTSTQVSWWTTANPSPTFSSTNALSFTIGTTSSPLALGVVYYYQLVAEANCFIAQTFSGSFESNSVTSGVEVSGPWSGPFPAPGSGITNFCYPVGDKSPPDSISAQLNVAVGYSEFDGVGVAFFSGPIYTDSESASGFDLATGCTAFVNNVGALTSLPIQCGIGAGVATEETWAVTFGDKYAAPLSGGWQTTVTLALEVCANGNAFVAETQATSGGIDWIQTAWNIITPFNPAPTPSIPLP